MHDNKIVRLEISVAAPVPNVWAALTQPQLIGQWMLDTPVDILTDWRENGELLERGDLHGLPFENRGKIVRFDPPNALEYTHWSSLSIVPDIPENYSVVRFELRETSNQTLLTLKMSNLLTFEILKHMEFYWKTALHLLKEVAESR
ncbi:SRPBCC family protein [Dyadobacter fermentans]|uniref:SRPBCC family protein n=1 Tax=Dyadobacter fermentans TaxID=94254 RepID=UPI001CC19319|nr:SRPBCC domain-containing protein [Dyadobacter fermentans]MBZ1360665.1 SRPBCC domain-containing protein [Dyadobacter fermentans]